MNLSVYDSNRRCKSRLKGVTKISQGFDRLGHTQFFRDAFVGRKTNGSENDAGIISIIDLPSQSPQKYLELNTFVDNVNSKLFDKLTAIIGNIIGKRWQSPPTKPDNEWKFMSPTWKTHWNMLATIYQSRPRLSHCVLSSSSGSTVPTLFGHVWTGHFKFISETPTCIEVASVKCEAEM